jgi:hypothetical protein
VVPPGARPSRITSHPTPYHRNVTTACYQVSARPSRLVRRLRACEGVLLCGWTRWRVTPYVRCGVWPSPSPRSHHMDVLKPHAGAVQRTTSDRSRGRLSLSRGWDWEWVVRVGDREGDAS